MCTKIVKNNQNSIGCSICDKFFHIACVKITKDQHAFLYKNKNITYKCAKCVNKKVIVEQDEANISGSNINPNGIIAELKTQCEHLKSEFQKQVDDLNKKLDSFMNATGIDWNLKIQQIEEKLKNCYAVVKQTETTHSATIEDLEIQNDILQRRLNRADIVVNGLPDGVSDLREPVVKIASLCNIELSPNDIQHCCYFRKGKSVLIKFNSVYVRDCIMAKYHRRGPILLCDIIDVNVRSKIYLNDHLNRAASKLTFICRRLKKCNRVRKFKLINADRPKAEMEMIDGTIKVLNLNECAELLDGDSDISISRTCYTAE